ncbi:conserved hypothetical protein, partial [Perkinsus marinus ATCC 50983]
LVGAESASSPPRGLSKTGKVLCPSGTGKQEYGYIKVSPLQRLVDLATSGCAVLAYYSCRRFFYTSIQADGNPTTAPTFLFIDGGPGSSSISPTLRMNGPCLMSPTSKHLVTNTFSWTRGTNGIWVDAPVPAGFSIGPVESGWDNLMQS